MLHQPERQEIDRHMAGHPSEDHPTDRRTTGRQAVADGLLLRRSPHVRADRPMRNANSLRHAAIRSSVRVDRPAERSRASRIGGEPPSLGSSRSEHQLSEHHAEDQDDQEDDDRNEEQNPGDAPSTRSNAGEAEKSGDQRDDEEDDGPFDHERSSQKWKTQNPESASFIGHTDPIAGSSTDACAAITASAWHAGRMAAHRAADDGIC